MNVLKKENFSLHLKALGQVKAFDVEMQFDEDAKTDKFSMLIDGEKLELIGNTESIFMELSKIWGCKIILLNPGMEKKSAERAN